MPKNLKNLTCWVVTEGIAGTENQCLGIAESLGVAPIVKRISLREPWKTMSPYLPFEMSWTFKPRLSPPWPDLVIASGRKSIAASCYIKNESDKKTFTVQVQDPRINARYFDLLAIPQHDPTRGENVIVTTASPNRITPEKLAEAKKAFPQFAKLKGLRVAVLIGGTSKAYEMSRAVSEKLTAQLKALDASLMITASRRTGAQNEAMLREALDIDGNYFWDGCGDNPYFAMLAWADFILVTADSASMLSEACTSGKPTYLIPLDGGHPRIDKMHDSLRQSGCLRDFDGKLESWQTTPLNDAAMVAEEIRKRMNL